MRSYFLSSACAALAAAVLLSAPAHAADAVKLDINGLLKTTQADLAAAKADADARGDSVASQCYGGISTYLSAHGGAAPSLPSVKGVASGFQAARDAVKIAEAAQANAGIPPELELACGPLALDVQSDLGKAATQLAVFGIKLPF